MRAPNAFTKRLRAEELVFPNCCERCAQYLNGDKNQILGWSSYACAAQERH